MHAIRLDRGTDACFSPPPIMRSAGSFGRREPEAATPVVRIVPLAPDAGANPAISTKEKRLSCERRFSFVGSTQWNLSGGRSRARPPSADDAPDEESDPDGGERRDAPCDRPEEGRRASRHDDRGGGVVPGDQSVGRAIDT